MWGTSWFGGSGGAQKRKDAPKKAILDLRQQLDMLQKREKHLENQMAEQEKIAKMNVSTNKTSGSTVCYLYSDGGTMSQEGNSSGNCFRLTTREQLTML